MGVAKRDTITDVRAGRPGQKVTILANQLGRRNLSHDSYNFLLGRRYLRVKKAHGGDRKSEQVKSRDRIDPLISTPPNIQPATPAPSPAAVPPKPVSTAATLARQHGVSEATVKRAAKFAAEVERSPRLQEAIASRDGMLSPGRTPAPLAVETPPTRGKDHRDHHPTG